MLPFDIHIYSLATVAHSANIYLTFQAWVSFVISRRGVGANMQCVKLVTSICLMCNTITIISSCVYVKLDAHEAYMITHIKDIRCIDALGKKSATNSALIFHTYYTTH